MAHPALPGGGMMMMMIASRGTYILTWVLNFELHSGPGVPHIHMQINPQWI